MADPRLCSIPDCGKPACNSRGWCWPHYQRWRRHGDPATLKRTPNGVAAAYFETTVLNYRGDDCLIWPFATRNGYAVLGRAPTHRLACEATNGPPPSPEHHAAHSCGKGRMGCVAPAHLRWATPTENNADKAAHGTLRRGEERVNAKLTQGLVREIRSLRGQMSQRAIAEHLGVSRAGVRNVLSGNTWSWLP